jgi:hypothetical protein
VATSLSWDYSLTGANVITTAYENLGVIAAGGTVATADSTTALTRLNLIAKQIGPSSGVNVQMHTRQRVSLMLAKGQQTYTIGPAATDSRSSTLLGRTTVSSAYASGTSLSVTGITDTTSYPGTTISMTSADFIGVVLNDGTIGWTTLNGTPGSSPVTLTAGFSAAASAGNYVYWFTSRAQRLIYIESAVLRDRNFNDTSLGVFRTAQQYEAGVASKQSDGDPTTILIEPLRINTKVTLDSQPTDVTKQIVLTGWYVQEDYDATSNDVAFPQEAYRWLCWELTSELAPAFGVEWTPKMEKNLLEARQTFLNMNPEVTDAYFRPGGV